MLNPLHVIRGVMARRMLVNWRVDPEVAAGLLPPGLRPKVIRGHAIAGLCLVRLERVRPAGVPEWLSLPSENVAARMAVEYGGPGGGGQSVLIFRRDTGSRVNALVGGRLFPGVHHHATFLVHEDAERVALTMRSADGVHAIDIAAQTADAIMPGSVFADMDEAVRFFRGGETGYSPGRRSGTWEGVRLTCTRWELRPMHMERVAASFVEDTFRFPAGSTELDSAFIMRDVEHTWTALPPMEWGVPRLKRQEEQVVFT